jgi:hypothetical protein
VGTVLTSEFVAKLRTLCADSRQLYLGCEVSGDVPEFEMLHAVEQALGNLDGLDSERLHELATWAREQARARDKTLALSRPGETERVDAAFGSDFTGNLRRKQAELARIVEISTDVLTALALDKLPAGALRVLGRECSLCDVEQPDDVARICTSSGCPRRREFDAGIRVNGSTLSWPNADERAGMREAAEYIEAANSKPGERVRIFVGGDVPDDHAALLTREQVGALPSHDRVVLGRIFAALLGAPALDTWVDSGDSAEEVWDEIEATLVALADALNLDEADWPTLIRRAPLAVRDAERRGSRLRHEDAPPRYSLPESHPLRQYQWAEWLERMLAADELAADAGFGLDVNGRTEWLRAAVARIEVCDVNGLRGLVELAHDDRESSPLSVAENDLLLFACGCDRLDRRLTEGKSFIGAGCHRVPRVRGATVEVGT